MISAFSHVFQVFWGLPNFQSRKDNKITIKIRKVKDKSNEHFKLATHEVDKSMKNVFKHLIFAQFYFKIVTSYIMK